MVRFIKLKDYKGIEEIRLSALGHINIICGKNNSGKSSVLECVMIKEKRSLGRKIEENNIDWWHDYAWMMCQTFTNPRSDEYMKWFDPFIKTQIGVIFYEDEIKTKEEEFLNARTSYLKGFGSRNNPPFKFSEPMQKFIEEISSSFSATLIPPKRHLELKVNVNFSQKIEPDGKGILNRLSYLKNQTENSKETKIYQRIYDVFTEVTDGYHFEISVDGRNNINITFSKDRINWIEGDACGLGLQDVLIILTFIIDSEYNFIMIEEPESHLHPYMQRKLMKFIADTKDKQFLLSTHSNVFLNPDFAHKIIHTEMQKHVTLLDDTSKAHILRNLGYSITDNLVSDLLILTEGPYDIPILREVLDKLGLTQKHKISFLPIGGDAMKHLDPTPLTENNKVIALIDNDPGSKKIRNLFKKKCRAKKIYCYQLKGYSIENYFSLAAIKSIFPAEVKSSIRVLRKNVKVEKQLGFSVKASGKKIMQNMSLADLHGTDLLNFCKRAGKIADQ